jgi:hypothetical protein
MKRAYVGNVVISLVGKGSKSEHEAVVLDTGDARYVLRREGGNAFRDEVLVSLVGKRIKARGEVVGSTLLIEGWDE